MRDVIIMVAPNGARKTKNDHPGLPVSIADTVSEAAGCYAAGASALHAHVRGSQDEHLLDAGGHARIGFENNLYLPNGEIADNSSALVASLVEKLGERDCQPASSASATQLLGVRSA